MSRGLTTAAAAAVAAETVPRTVAVELDFAGGFVRINGSPADITIDGHTFVGVGGLGAISTVEESSELRSYDLTVQLSGVPADSVALALTETYQGRAGTVWEVPLDPTTGLPVADPIVIFRGRMDTLDVNLGPSATVSVTLQNRLADWERPNNSRYTDEDQKRLFSFDRGLELVPSTVEKQIVWPSAAWWDNNR